ncbi:hypothetical protein BGZ76_008003, partial [Entomortierella beljakovae]
MTTIKQKDVYVAASSIVHIHMDDAEQVFGEELPDLVQRTKEPSLADPPPFLKDILHPLKEQSMNDHGDIDGHKLSLLIEQKIGSMATEELNGGSINEQERTIFKILNAVASLCKEYEIPRPKDSEQKSQGVWE